MGTKILKISAFTFLLFIFMYFFYMLFIFRGNNPKERNTLSFNSDFDSVLSSIKEMNNILDSSSINEYFFYAIEKDILYVKSVNNKSQKIGSVKDTLLYKNESISFIDTIKRKDFVNLSAFLTQNFLDRCDYENGNYLYLYRANIDMGDMQKDLMRYVVLANDIRDLNLKKYKVLDNKGDLFLLADKDAEIWEN